MGKFTFQHEFLEALFLFCKQKFCNKQNIICDGWVGDEVGGIASFACQYFFNLADIILDLKTKRGWWILISGVNNTKIKLCMER